MSDPNLFAPAWEFETPARRAVQLARAAGARDLGASLYELGPGGAVSPYHRHYANEELLIVISGRPLLRTPEGTRVLEPGAVVAFLPGPDGAHRVANTSDEPVRVLLVSTMRFPEVVEYPTTGAVLTVTAPGQRKAFNGESPWSELVTAALAADAEIDQRGTSTT